MARAEVEALERGLEQVRAFEYDEAIATFRGIVDAPSASAEERLLALERIAAVEHGRGDQGAAREAFAELLDCDPEHRLTERAFPPPVEALFEEVRGAHSPRSVVSLSVDAEVSGDQVTLRLRGAGSVGAIAEALVSVRAPGESAFERLEMTRQGEAFVIERPAPPPGESLEYFVTARAPSGHELASVGSEATPRQVTTELVEPIEPAEPAPERPRWYRSWWFWTVVGVVVAGGVAAGVAVPLATAEPPTGSLGAGQLE